MSPFDVGLMALGGMVALVLAGLTVPIALMACSFLGVWAIKGSAELASTLLALSASDTIASYYFGVVPLFVLMGFLVAEAGIGRDAFRRGQRRLPAACAGAWAWAPWAPTAVFAAITGISIASAAVFTRIAVPEMRRHGYAARFAVGIVAGSSVLGMLIPPSLLLILYGVLTEQSIGDLFIAGILPGLLLALLFGVGVVALATFAPRFTGRPEGAAAPLPWPAVASKAAPIAALIGLVLGGIYGGLFTPVEAGAVGAIGAFALGLAKRTLSPAGLWRVLIETGLVTASVCFLIISGADVFPDARLLGRARGLRGARGHGRDRALGDAPGLRRGGGRDGHDPRLLLDPADPRAADAARGGALRGGPDSGSASSPCSRWRSGSSPRPSGSRST